MINLEGSVNTAKVFTDNIDETTINQLVDMLNEPIAENMSVRVMPDTHAGKGAVVGTVFKSEGEFTKVSPNVVGVDLGCFTGDTKVALADGRNLTFIELIDEYNMGIENFCYSQNEDGEVEINKIDIPRKIRRDNELVHITLDNGEVIKATLDHIFYDRDNHPIEAKDLYVGLSLYPFYKEKVEDVKDKVRFNKANIHKVEKYHAIYQPNIDVYDLAHILADKYNERNNLVEVGKVYENGRTSFVRHHKDFNKYNNNPNNIRRMGYKAHWKLHSDSVKKTNELGITGFKAAIKKHPNLLSEAGRARAEATWNGLNSEKNRVALSERTKRLNESGVLNSVEQRENARERQLKNNTNNFNSQNKDKEFQLKQKIAKYARIAQYIMSVEDKITEDNWNRLRKDIAINSPKFSTMKAVIDKEGYSINDLLKVKVKDRKNHKVESIEIVNYEDGVDVYCLTNFTNHTFALSAGVFVHNCGIMMKNLGQVDIDLASLDIIAQDVVPTGFNVNNKIEDNLKEEVEGLLGNLVSKDSLGGKRYNRTVLSVGSLGGGNHYIELAESENGDKWLSVHTGSRGLGTFVAKYWQDVAESGRGRSEVSRDEIRELRDRLIQEGRKEDIGNEIVKLRESKTKGMSLSKELSYLEDEELKGYLNDMNLAQQFAVLSRNSILTKIIDEYNIRAEADLKVVDEFDSIHNFIDLEHNILRKGATSAQLGERLVIPLNMRDGSLICVGKGNEDWAYSAPHGAGRAKSRTQAKREVDLEKYKDEMKGIYTSSVNSSTLDEAPEAYKPAEEIKELIKPTVDIVHELKPLWNLKDHTKESEG